MLASTRVMPTCRPFTASRAAPAVRRAPLTVVCVKPTKLADFRTLADEEVVKKISDLKRELATTRFIQKTRGVTELKGGQEQQQPSADKVPKGHLNKHLRRQVAQLWTLLRERQIAQGINNRTFKKLSRAL